MTQFYLLEKFKTEQGPWILQFSGSGTACVSSKSKVNFAHSRFIVQNRSHNVKPAMNGQNIEKIQCCRESHAGQEMSMRDWGLVSPLVACLAANQRVLGLIEWLGHISPWTHAQGSRARVTWTCVGQMFQSSSCHCVDGFWSIKQLFVRKWHKLFHTLVRKCDNWTVVCVLVNLYSSIQSVCNLIIFILVQAKRANRLFW